MKGPVQLGPAIEELLACLGLSGVAARARLAKAWPQVVGEFLASRTAPGPLRGGVLTVTVESHVLAQELAFSKPALLARIREIAGGGLVSDLRFRVGPLSPPPGPEPACREERAPACLPPEGLDKIADPEMRALLLSLAHRAAGRPSR